VSLLDLGEFELRRLEDRHGDLEAQARLVGFVAPEASQLHFSGPVRKDAIASSPPTGLTMLTKHHAVTTAPVVTMIVALTAILVPAAAFAAMGSMFGA